LSSRNAVGPGLVLAVGVGLLLLAGCTGPIVPGGGTVPGSVAGQAPSGAGPALAVEMGAVEFRPEGHPEDAAASYVVRLVNRGGTPLVVRMDHDAIRGVDDSGTEYEDYWSQAERNAEGCVCAGCQQISFAKLTHLEIPLAPQESKETVLYLNPVGSSGDCERNGRARARLKPGAGGIEVTLPDVSFTPAAGSPLKGVTLRLEA